jgi:predicted RNA-binding protein with PIN domain
VTAEPDPGAPRARGDADDLPAGTPPPPAPPADLLAALPTDVWAWLLPHVRAALHDLADATPIVRRLRDAPTGKLAGGRVRRELVDLLAADRDLWPLVARRVRAAPAPPDAVRWLLAGSAERANSVSFPQADLGQGPAIDDERDDLRERLRTVRDQRDTSRRQLAGAEARATALERRLADAEADRAAAEVERDRLAAELADAGSARDRAVERERRRRDAEVERLEATIADLRRAEHERRTEQQRRAEEARRRAAEEANERRRAASREPEAPARLEPGRPSRLPRGVVEGTTEAVELLLHPGRFVLVDGYNVTKQRHPGMDLEAQRAWLVQLLASLAARRRVRPVVVFDGERGAASRAGPGGREVQVRFTPSGVTADDEIALAVEATDEPVVVVTDDRELVARVRASGADVIATRPFLAAVR